MAPMAPNPGDGGTKTGGGNLVPAPQNNMNPFMPGFPSGQSTQMFGGEAMGTVPSFGLTPGWGGFSSNFALPGVEFPGAAANPTAASGQVLNALRKDLQSAGLGSEASYMLSSMIQNGMLQDPFALNSLAGIMGAAPQDFGSLANFAGQQTGGFQGFNNSAFQKFLQQAAGNFGTLQNQAAGESATAKGDVISNFQRLLGQAQGEVGQFGQQAMQNFNQMLGSTNMDWNQLLQSAQTNFGGVADKSNSQFSNVLNQLQQFMAGGSGYNPQVAQALFAQMQPQISQQERDIAERFGGQGLASSSSGSLGMADYLGQVNANQQATNANLYQQSIQNFLAAQGLAGQDISSMLGVDLGAAQGLTSAQTAAAGGKAQASEFAAQGLTAAQGQGLQDLLGAQTASAQGISQGELSILQSLLGTQTAAAQGLTGAQLAGTQGMTSNDLSAMQTLLSTDSQAMQNMFGTELGAAGEFGNIYQGGMQDVLGILNSSKRNKGGGILGGLGSLLGGLGGGSGIADIAGLFGL